MIEQLDIERFGAIARIVLNRSDAGNTIDENLAEAFAEAAAQVASDGEVRVVVLTGAGSLFCGGGDVRAMAAAPDGASAVIDRITSNLHRGSSHCSRCRSRW
ncbi:enoyl-CoA hydratase-related protein [Sphingomonas daechungensis]|uniref:enoyl-CoA hydratase-related protein n=1 Tax=Sphingomonas daechungensis TaxID=1176646 RepID=UPI00294FFFAB|nr:enoyl-CoA hydratase-related protein [Sphingomonas daechungensis]